MEIKKEEYKEFLTEDYLSFKEAASLLEISEDELRSLAKKHLVQTHNVAGAFLRLKKREVEELKIKWRIERGLFPKAQKTAARENTVLRARWLERIQDFWYFNDFYILCSALIMLLIYVILSSQ